ncbi:putative serine/threonine-protein kinase [Arachis hypogaea]|uniref:Putative serine/threonine-protein kinase n=1 Tax=Arachis hypogaea TaxID=3818 RepID=A0A6B9V5K3_ARAHY|nr:putative serine/threonine-protein kinase [Arachis hypogaea]
MELFSVGETEGNGRHGKTVDAGTAVEKSKEQFRNEINKLLRQQRENGFVILEAFKGVPSQLFADNPFLPMSRDRNEPEGQPPVKRRLSSAVVRVEEEGELIQDDPAHAPKSVNTNGTSATNRISRFLFVDAGTMVSPTVYARRSLCYLINDIYQEALNDAVQTRMISPVWHIAFYLESVVLGGLGMENEAQVAIKEATTLESKRSSNAKQK